MTINWKSLDILNADGVFYTDANAFKMIKRFTDQNKTFPINNPLNKQKQVAANFYPVNSGIMIENGKD